MLVLLGATACGSGDIEQTPDGGVNQTNCGPLETYQNGICVAKLVQVSENFAMDATEVTRSQYEAWLDTEPSPTYGPVCTWNSSLTPEYEWPPGDKGSHPVVGVDWCDAWEYCNAVGKRLCRGEFEDPGDTEWANVCSSSGASGYFASCHMDPGTTVPVASKNGCQGSAEPYAGIFDLIGNVGEWEMSCESGTTGTSQKVCHVRGYGPDPAGCDQTLQLAREATNNYVGFRCCWSPSEN
jgi:formylglycine-generating enzyme required for sulfatase activity